MSMTAPLRRPSAALRFDLRTPPFGPSATEKFGAALELVQCADTLGFDYVQISEHHGAEDGYCPAPIPVATAFAARSRRLRVRISALLAPLYHPIRLAEDLAVADLLSGSRLEVVLGAGYRRAEFDDLEVDFQGRSRRLVESVKILRDAWSGKPFAHLGRTVRVTPVPEHGGPQLFLAGSSRSSALRAARLQLAFLPQNPSLYEAYEEECQRLGHPIPARVLPLAYLVIVAEDPEAAWSYYGRHLLHDMNAYGAWLAEAGMAGSFRPIDDLNALRTSGKYLILTPDECVAAVKDAGPDCNLMLHPLVGGTSVDRAHELIELVASKVLPRLG